MLTDISPQGNRILLQSFETNLEYFQCLTAFRDDLRRITRMIDELDYLKDLQGDTHYLVNLTKLGRRYTSVILEELLTPLIDKVNATEGWKTECLTVTNRFNNDCSVWVVAIRMQGTSAPESV